MNQAKNQPIIQTSGYAMIKRIIDVVVSMMLLLLFSPVMAVVAMAIFLTMGQPILFRQVRAGYKGEPFEVLKFRTMLHPTSKDGRTLTEAERITPVGRFLRKTSLDELPQLCNVIRGDMSLVGPRPLYVSYLDYYTVREARRHDVRPGITGLAQVSGRNYLPWDERLELDVQYVENASFWLDVRILFQTLIRVVAAKDVTVVPGQARMLLSEERAQQRNQTLRDTAK